MVLLVCDSTSGALFLGVVGRRRQMCIRDRDLPIIVGELVLDIWLLLKGGRA